MDRRLPTEILHQIISAFASGHKSIIPLILTCHRLRQVAEPIFYGFIDTRAVWPEHNFQDRLTHYVELSIERINLLDQLLGERMALLVQTLAGVPRLARYVRELKVHCDPAPNSLELLHKMFQNLTNLQSLFISALATGRVCISLQAWTFRLESLTWHLGDSMSPEHVRFLTSQSSLKSLYLGCLSFLPLPATALPNLTHLDTIPIGLPALLSGGRVSSLVLQSYSGQPVSGTEWECLAPSLRLLKHVRFTNAFHTDLSDMAKYLGNLERLMLDAFLSNGTITSILRLRSLVHLKIRWYPSCAITQNRGQRSRLLETLFQGLPRLHAVDIEMNSAEFHRFFQDHVTKPVAVQKSIEDDDWVL